jgi:NADH-quinone oxidoreductase subunit M
MLEINWLNLIYWIIPIIIIFLLIINNILIVKIVSLIGSFFLLILGNFLWLGFKPLEIDYQYQILLINNKLFTFHLGIDGISLFFVLLTLFLLPICLLASWSSITIYIKEFNILFYITIFLLINVFCVLDLLIFYVVYESILIPMFLIIGIWGSRDRKIHAAYQFFLYTLFGSVIMLLALLYIYIKIGSLHITNIGICDYTLIEGRLLWMAFFASFAVKVPMIPLHIWLPEAHVEAPTAGSVLLAGILLKMGVYGMLRFSLPMFPEATIYYQPVVFLFSIISIVYGATTTLRQTDLKKVIAYSSVVHMNYITIGVLSDNIYGIEGAIFLMISHGLVSSALFLCIGFLYERYHTRVLLYYGGLVTIMPVFSIAFFILVLANVSLPGTSSFIGEFLIFLGMNVHSTSVIFCGVIGILLGTAFTILLFNRIIFGVGNIEHAVMDLNKREFFVIFFCIFLSLLFGLFPNLILDMLHTSILVLLLT